MRQGEVINRVMRTRNYEQFKTLLGNRLDAEVRGKTIARSIQENGYIFNPIVVNENYEVIDGQGRLCALKSLNLPVDYIVVSGLKVKDCITLNIYQKSWNLIDYIKSYAEMGNSSYMRLSNLISKYKAIPYTTVIFSVTETLGGSSKNADIKSGLLELDEETYSKAQSRLNYVMNFIDTMNATNKGNKNYIMRAIIFAYDQPEIDNERLLETFKRLYNTKVAAAFVDIDGALKSLSACYNFKSRGERVSLDVMYDNYQRSRIKGYEKRWSKYTN